MYECICIFWYFYFLFFFHLLQIFLFYHHIEYFTVVSFPVKLLYLLVVLTLVPPKPIINSPLPLVCQPK